MNKRNEKNKEMGQRFRHCFVDFEEEEEGEEEDEDEEKEKKIRRKKSDGGRKEKRKTNRLGKRGQSLISIF